MALAISCYKYHKIIMKIYINRTVYTSSTFLQSSNRSAMLCSAPGAVAARLSKPHVNLLTITTGEELEEEKTVDGVGSGSFVAIAGKERRGQQGRGSVKPDA